MLPCSEAVFYSIQLYSLVILDSEPQGSKKDPFYQMLPCSLAAFYSIILNSLEFLDSAGEEIKRFLLINFYWTKWIPDPPRRGGYKGINFKNCPICYQGLLKYIDEHLGELRTSLSNLTKVNVWQILVPGPNLDRHILDRTNPRQTKPRHDQT